ncbi:hypothetical protein P3L10_017937 [Capsicum annuum]
MKTMSVKGNYSCLFISSNCREYITMVWILPVAASSSSIDRSFPTLITLGNNWTFAGQSLYTGKETGFISIAHPESSDVEDKRYVATVSDGLKARELLKGRPHNIDLILTEVDLPSISGYALLTLIMEHDICKNMILPFSSYHCRRIYRCMLRGAADFLVKPVRKNELRNLWQHVWRRRSASGSSKGRPLDESVAQPKVEATAENNACSNRSSGYKACV